MIEILPSSALLLSSLGSLIRSHIIVWSKSIGDLLFKSSPSLNKSYLKYYSDCRVTFSGFFSRKLRWLQWRTEREVSPRYCRNGKAISRKMGYSYDGRPLLVNEERETDDINRRKSVRRFFQDGNSRYQKKHPRFQETKIRNQICS